MGFELLIVDESHRFKSFNGTRTKALHKLTLQEQLEYRYILTGSPVLQDACDLWSQFFILDPKILGANFYTFRNKYFYDANAGMPSNVHFPNYIPKDEKYYKRMGLPYEDVNETLNTIIYKHASRVMKDDVLDLPPYIEQKIPLDFSKDQGRIYKEMRDDLVATLDNKDLSFFTEQPSHNDHTNNSEIKDMLDMVDAEVMAADLAIVKTLRLMQIAAGIFVNEEGNTTVLPTQLADDLKERLESICSNKANKVIVWSIFKPTYEVIANICESLGLKYTFLTGLQDKDQKQANVDQFNEDPDCQVIIANQAAGGTGVNLTAANYDYYYSFDFSLEKYLQSNSRGYRGGQTRQYTSYKPYIENSIMEKALAALEEKAANAEDILKVRKEFSRQELLNLI